MSGESTRWLEDMAIGLEATTTGRTITETDLVNFTGIVGLQEELFVNFAKGQSVSGDHKRHMVPGILVFSYAEGLVAQIGWLRGSGRAFMETSIQFLRPVMVGDTVSARVRVVSVERSPSGNSGRVTFDIVVDTDSEEGVIKYSAARLVRAKAKRKVDE